MKELLCTQLTVFTSVYRNRSMNFVNENTKIDLLNFDNVDTPDTLEGCKAVNLTRTHLCRKMPFNNLKLGIKFH